MVFCLPENKCVRVAHDTSEPGVNDLKFTTTFKEGEVMFVISVLVSCLI